MTPAAILFDLDGTLVDSERENVESVVLAARKVGLELSAAEREFIVGHSWNEIHSMIAANHGYTGSMDEIIALAVEQKGQLLAFSGYRALPGAVETVRRLGRRSALAVVSGASRVEVRDAVESLGLTGDFQVVLGSEDYPRGKPAPDPYLMAMTQLGAAPRRCIAIEDASPGIASALAAGARVIAVSEGNFTGFDLSAADIVVKTLYEITDELCDNLIADG